MEDFTKSFVGAEIQKLRTAYSGSVRETEEKEEQFKQQLQKLAITEEGTELTERVNRALPVMHSTIHAAVNKTPIELHHGRNPRTEQTTTTVKDGKTYHQISQRYIF